MRRVGGRVEDGVEVNVGASIDWVLKREEKYILGVEHRQTDSSRQWNVES